MHRSILDARNPLEPYRLFFPLGILLGLLGVSVWPIYSLGWGIAPSAAGHVGLQIQGFVLCFALGFLMTAIPKFLGSPPVRLGPQLVLAGLVLVSAAGFWLDRGRLAEAAFLLVLAGLGLVLLQAFRARIVSPPEPLAAVLLGLLCGLAGGLLKLLVWLGQVDPSLMLLGRRMLSEGMILLLVLGIGGKLGPLLLGYPTGTPRPRFVHGIAALAVIGSLIAQYGFGYEAGAWARAAAVLAASAWNARFWRLPRTRTALSWGVYLSHWMLLAGLFWSAAMPQYRIEALHLVFVGGFSVLILAVGMRVALAHGGYPLAWELRSRPLLIGMTLFLLATLTRVGAKFAPDTYLMHLALAGGLWMLGLLVWGAVLVSRILIRVPRQDQSLQPLAPLHAGGALALPRT